MHLSPCDQSQNVKLKIYTLAFRKVADKNLVLPAGPDPVILLTDSWGNQLANGLYYLVFDTPEGRSIQKILILR